jgi:hypothetical protein
MWWLGSRAEERQRMTEEAKDMGCAERYVARHSQKDSFGYIGDSQSPRVAYCLLYNDHLDSDTVNMELQTSAHPQLDKTEGTSRKILTYDAKVHQVHDLVCGIPPFD